MGKLIKRRVVYGCIKPMIPATRVRPFVQQDVNGARFIQTFIDLDVELLAVFPATAL
jgi:hypothetical protein